MNGFIKFFRILLSLDYMHDTSILAVTVYLLVNARFMPTSINGFPIESGQLVVNIRELAEEYKLTIKNVKYILDVLVEINAIRMEKTGNYQYIITLLPLLLTGMGISSELIYSKENTSIDYNTSPLFRAYSRKKPVQLSDKEESPLDKEEGSAELFENEYLPFGEEFKPTDNSYMKEIAAAVVDEIAGVDEADEVAEADEVNEIDEISEITDISAENENPEEDVYKQFRNYGKFRNVCLTDEEYEELKKLIPSYEKYIEHFSAYIAANHNKYKNHFAAIYSWYLKDIEKNEKKYGNGAKTPASPLYPNATSYDLARAEKRALESVPKLKKRERR